MAYICLTTFLTNVQNLIKNGLLYLKLPEKKTLKNKVLVEKIISKELYKKNIFLFTDIQNLMIILNNNPFSNETMHINI